MPVDVGQPEMPALEFEGQPFVVNSHEMEDSGLQIVNVNRIGDGIETEVIRGTV